MARFLGWKCGNMRNYLLVMTNDVKLIMLLDWYFITIRYAILFITSSIDCFYIGNTFVQTYQIRYAEYHGDTSWGMGRSWGHIMRDVKIIRAHHERCEYHGDTSWEMGRSWGHIMRDVKIIRAHHERWQYHHDTRDMNMNTIRALSRRMRISGHSLS